jgi:hypothetical protein
VEEQKCPRYASSTQFLTSTAGNGRSTAIPADRKGSGVRRYRILRSVDDPNVVMIDLEFDSVAEAEGLLDTMRQVWSGPGRTFMRDPRARIAESVETREL